MCIRDSGGSAWGLVVLVGGEAGGVVRRLDLLPLLVIDLVRAVVVLVLELVLELLAVLELLVLVLERRFDDLGDRGLEPLAGAARRDLESDAVALDLDDRAEQPGARHDLLAGFEVVPEAGRLLLLLARPPLSLIHISEPTRL